MKLSLILKDSETDLHYDQNMTITTEMVGISPGDYIMYDADHDAGYSVCSIDWDKKIAYVSYLPTRVGKGPNHKTHNADPQTAEQQWLDRKFGQSMEEYAEEA